MKCLAVMDVSSHVSTTPDRLQILGARSSTARCHVRVIEDMVREKVVSGARALEHIGMPVPKAHVATILLSELAKELDPRVPPKSLATLWQREGFRESLSPFLAEFRKAFLLSPSLIDDFREADPSFCFNYIVYREILHGRSPVLSSDIKDTLAPLVNGKVLSSLRPQEQRAAIGFRGVRDRLDSLLSLGPVYLVTGDTHETVVEQFVIPNGWASLREGALIPTSTAARNLAWLPRTGMEIVTFAPTAGHFTRSQLVSGLSADEISRVVSILERVKNDLNIVGFFTENGRHYAHRPNRGPCSYEIRSGVSAGDVSIAFYPAGILETSARPIFSADAHNAVFLEEIVVAVNQELRSFGLSHVRAKRGGLSTVDLVTSDKGSALACLRESFVGKDEFVVFLGDRIALNGNDVEAINVADLSIQVGSEWNSSLFPPGNGALLRSQRIAAEGGAAEYISGLTAARRLALTKLLAPLESPSAPNSITLPTQAPVSDSGSLIYPPRFCQPWETRAALQPLIPPTRTLPAGANTTTKWVVLTGATCAGKTTTLRALEQMGFKVLHEVARGYLQQELEKGRSWSEVRADERQFRQEVFALTKNAEDTLLYQADQLIFLDRAAIDSVSFHRAAGLDPNEIAQQLSDYRYGSVFHLDRLPFEDDGLRTVNEERRAFLDTSLELDYRSFDYRPIRVPVMEVAERVSFILDRIMGTRES